MSARSLPGRRRCGPRRDRTAVTASGMPWAPETTCILLPDCRGRPGIEGRRQMPPCTPAGQHVHHHGEHRPFVQRRGTTTLRTPGERRQQRAGQLPITCPEPAAATDQHHEEQSCRSSRRHHVRHRLTCFGSRGRPKKNPMVRHVLNYDMSIHSDALGPFLICHMYDGMDSVFDNLTWLTL